MVNLNKTTILKIFLKLVKLFGWYLFIPLSSLYQKRKTHETSKNR